MRVLIVDDEATVRTLMRRWIETEGATVVEAESAEQALERVHAEGEVAVAFCDLRMPGRDGLWLADQLRTLSPSTAVVMTTAITEFEVAVSSLQSGAIDYIAKPFPRERLVEALQRAYTAHQSRRTMAAMHDELTKRRSQVSDALGQLEMNAASILDAMLAILRARDPEASEHAHRVAKLSVDLAMMLQIGEPQLSDIERAALLHDLGLLAMPDELRAKPEAALSEGERAQLRTYPLHGHAMLKNHSLLAAASDLAVAVNERYDGTGFPHGLIGDQIPIGARIISVANAFDELTTGAGSHVTAAEAVGEMTERRTGEFDPLVLGALQMLQPGPSAG